MSRATLRALRMTATALLLTPGLALAQGAGGGSVDHPVLLELYTAQGCASCPPADDMLIELASREDVIALALHVDYWDYIGWADTFGSRANTERQQRYARRHGHTTIYTPQVIVNGTQIVEGFRVMEVLETIEQQQARADEVDLSLARVEGGLLIRAEPTPEAAPQIAMASRRSAMAGMSSNSVVGSFSMSGSAAAAAAPEAETEGEDEAVADAASDAATGALAEAAPESLPPAPAADARIVIGGSMRVARGLTEPGAAPYSVQLVRYRPAASVEILDGENAGHRGQYANIVTSWQILGSWDLMEPLEVTVPLEGDEPAVVIVQENGQGEVVASARLR